MLQNNLLMAATTNASGGGGSTVSVSKSALFNLASSEYLSLTPTASDDDINTMSCWLYRGRLTGALQYFWASGPSGMSLVGFTADEQLLVDKPGARVLTSTQVFRDIGWYHIVMGLDVTNGTATNRVTVEVNGAEITAWATDNRASLSAGDFTWGDNVIHGIGATGTGVSFFDGYIAEFTWIDGTKYSASDFGAYDTTGLYWTPKSSTAIKALTFGDEGFYLDNTTNAQTDASGNGNSWTNNNTVTTDVNSPTNISGLINQINPNVATLSNGNKTVTSTGTSDQTNGVCTLPCTGKVYFEFEYSVVGTDPSAGVIDTSLASEFDNYVGSGSSSWGWHLVDGDLYNSGSVSASTPSTLAVNTRGCIAFDTATGNFWTGQLSGSTVTWDNSGNPATGSNPITSSIPTSNYWSAVVSGRNSCSISLYTTSNDFEVSALPTGFTAIDTTNIASDISRSDSNTNKYFEATLYTGSGSEKSVQSSTTTNTSAFSWIKNRGTDDNHMLFDRVRGVTKDWHSNSDAIQATNVQTVKAFLGGGVTIGTDVEVNTSSENYVLWNWMMSASGGGSSNEDGSINTTATLVDTTLGLSISQYTGTGSNATIGHGLGAVPKFIIIKNLDVAEDPAAYHEALGNTKRIFLNSSNSPSSSTVFWQNTTPTSSVISIGTDSGVNQSSQTFICYAFTDSQFVSIGSYAGNGDANGSFVPTLNSLGLPIQPVWAITRSSASSSWQIFDNKRAGYNVANAPLLANIANDESAPGNVIDIVTGGLKMRNTSDPNVSATYIYMVIGTPIIDTDGRIIAGR